MKPTTPFGSIPVITVDGQVSSQSGAVLRYAGKLANIYPTCPSSALVVDEIVDVMADFVNCLFRYSGDDKDLLREDRTKAVEVDIPRLVGGIEKRISQVGRDGPWAVGDSITIADLAIANVVRNCKQGIFEHIPENVFDKYERFMKSYEAVYEHPKVAAYYEKMNAGK